MDPRAVEFVIPGDKLYAVVELSILNDGKACSAVVACSWLQNVYMVPRSSNDDSYYKMAKTCYYPPQEKIDGYLQSRKKHSTSWDVYKKVRILALCKSVGQAKEKMEHAANKSDISESDSNLPPKRSRKGVTRYAEESSQSARQQKRQYHSRAAGNNSSDSDSSEPVRSVPKIDLSSKLVNYQGPKSCEMSVTHKPGAGSPKSRDIDVPRDRQPSFTDVFSDPGEKVSSSLHTSSKHDSEKETSSLQNNPSRPGGKRSSCQASSNRDSGDGTSSLENNTSRPAEKRSPFQASSSRDSGDGTSSLQKNTSRPVEPDSSPFHDWSSNHSEDGCSPLQTSISEVNRELPSIASEGIRMPADRAAQMKTPSKELSSESVNRELFNDKEGTRMPADKRATKKKTPTKGLGARPLALKSPAKRFSPLKFGAAANPSYRVIQTQLSDIRKRIDGLYSIVNRILRIMSGNVEGPTVDFEGEKVSILPLNSLDDVKSFEKYLEEGENLLEMVSYLADYGSTTSLKDSVYGVMKKLMSNKLASQMNLFGIVRKGKAPKQKFHSTPSHNIIMAAIKRHCNDLARRKIDAKHHYDETSANTHISNWLSNAPKRLKNETPVNDGSDSEDDIEVQGVNP